MYYSTRLQKLRSSVWGYAIDIPFDILEELKSNKIKRVVCVLNNSIEFQTGIMSNRNKGSFITLNKEIVKQLNLQEGSEINVILKEDKSKYGLPICEEFQEFLLQDDEFEQLFHSLTPGKQRNLIYIAGNYKTSNTRFKKTLIIVNYLKSTNGKLDYKELNEAFKA